MRKWHRGYARTWAATTSRVRSLGHWGWCWGRQRADSIEEKQMAQRIRTHLGGDHLSCALARPRVGEVARDEHKLGSEPVDVLDREPQHRHLQAARDTIG